MSPPEPAALPREALRIGGIALGVIAAYAIGLYACLFFYRVGGLQAAAVLAGGTATLAVSWKLWRRALIALGDATREPSAAQAATFSALVLMLASVLAVMTAPKHFFDGYMIRRSAEGSTKGNLGSLRSAMSIYYGEHEGVYPLRPSEGLIPRYLDSIPKARIPGRHKPSAGISLLQATRSDDSGGWGYNANPADKEHGSIWVNCTHTDAKGSVWADY